MKCIRATFSLAIYRCLLLAILVTTSPAIASDKLQCRLQLLNKLGWNTERIGSGGTATQLPAGSDLPFSAKSSSACRKLIRPTFFYPSVTSQHRHWPETIKRADQAIASLTSRCMFSRRYGRSVRSAVDKLINNKQFTFPTTGVDPRDPFIPPKQSWLPARKRGYDIPANSLSHAVESLYRDSYVAECAAAKQVAQLASLYEHYQPIADDMIHPRETGVGIWRSYQRSPAIAARSALIINRGKRKQALAELARLGRFAFNGQMGYIRAAKGRDFIDSPDNFGQNFLITQASHEAVDALRTRKKPLRELSALSKTIWKKYYKRWRNGESKKALRVEFEHEITHADAFFSGIKIYVHPLKVKTFGYHVARQFFYNPRTPFSFEVYEDYLAGHFFKRFISHSLRQCSQTPWCRRVDKKHHLLMDSTGSALPTHFTSAKACQRELAKIRQ